MFNITGQNKYLDIAELVLYNGALSGISLQGDTFFYTNYLEVDDNLQTYNAGSKVRQAWFGCSCCPTSYARFIPQLGTFLWSAGDGEIAMNIPAACHADLKLPDGRTISVKVESLYPYDGAVRIFMETSGEYKLTLRIPDWCRKYSVKVNGENAGETLFRCWQSGDVVDLCLDMPVRVIRSNPQITGNNGRIALKRGPMVYALEQTDNEAPVREIIIDTGCGFELAPAGKGLGQNAIAITGRAVREYFSDCEELYTDAEPQYENVSFKAIPYALWQNRGECNMAVWVRAK